MSCRLQQVLVCSFSQHNCNSTVSTVSWAPGQQQVWQVCWATNCIADCKTELKVSALQ